MLGVWHPSLSNQCRVVTYDDQIQLNADIATNPDLSKTTDDSCMCEESPALFPHARVVSSLRNNYRLVFIFRSGTAPLFYQRDNARDIEKSKLIGHRVTTGQSRRKLNYCSPDCRRSKWPSDPFPFQIFLSPLGRMC